MIKGGFIAWGAMGDSAASLMTCEPILMRPQWGAFGRAPAALSACFVHPLAIARDLPGTLGLARRCCRSRAREGCRSATCCGTIPVRKSPSIRKPFDVFVDGVLATCEPARELPLARRYMLR